MCLSKYSNGRRTYMDHLAKLLAQTKARSGPVESPNDAENSFSAASFLAKVLDASEEAHPSDRSQADDIVSTASPGIAVRDLEERFLVQFTLGRLYIPAGVRRAGFARVSDEIEFSPEPAGDCGRAVHEISRFTPGVNTRRVTPPGSQRRSIVAPYSDKSGKGSLPQWACLSKQLVTDFTSELPPKPKPEKLL
ncbi:MAG: hypothetical protein EOP06_06235 [Proteobacteria bacterium]|nr:MAG: hypothetical protein EOP06_06235 [Pseudomonadota bacterium]